MEVLQLNNLTIGYSNRVVQRGLSLVAKASSLTCLLGTNGCGKSTLLRTIALLQPALQGTIVMDGRRVDNLSCAERSQLFSLVLTDVFSVENLRVEELVALGRTPYTGWFGHLSAQDVAVVRQALADVKLLHKKDDYFHSLSDGEKQRAVIAKALAQDTPIVLLDEPTAHLDLPNRIEIMLLLRRLAHDTGKCFVVAMHELELAMQVADNIWLMSADGVEVGVPEDLMRCGSFQRCFSSPNYRFSERDGSFVLNAQASRIGVAVNGDGVNATWLCRALHRVGCKVDADAQLQIDANDEGYVVCGERFTSVEQVIAYVLRTK